MTYRIELLFVGDAPEDELQRAHIMADPAVYNARMDLSKALEKAGFPHEVTARTVRGTERKRRTATVETLPYRPMDKTDAAE